MFLKAVSVLGIVALSVAVVVVVVVQLVVVVVPLRRLWVFKTMRCGRLVAPHLEYSGSPPRRSTPWSTIQPPKRSRLD
jgi:hypothetical protein